MAELGDIPAGVAERLVAEAGPEAGVARVVLAARAGAGTAAVVAAPAVREAVGKEAVAALRLPEGLLRIHTETQITRSRA